MTYLVEQGVNMLGFRLMSVDENPLFAREQFAVNFISQEMNKYHLDPNMLGQGAKNIFFPMFLHLRR